MIEPQATHSISSFMREVNDKYGSRGVEVPHGVEGKHRVSYGEAEWEFWVSKLHGNYLGSTPEDLQTIKNIANRL